MARILQSVEYSLVTIGVFDRVLKLLGVNFSMLNTRPHFTIPHKRHHIIAIHTEYLQGCHDATLNSRLRTA